MNSDTAADAIPRIMVLRNQRGKEVSNSLVKFSKLAPVGMSWEELRVPSGLRADETTNRIGKMEKARASTPTRWRHPTRRNHPPCALPSRTTSCGVSSTCSPGGRIGVGSIVSEGGMSSDIS
jgi:hypothetical protein